MSLYRGSTVDGRSIEVHVSNGVIVSVTDVEPNIKDPLIAIPLVDTQNNGGLGNIFSAIADWADTLPSLISFYRSHGVGYILPTLVSAPSDVLHKAVSTLTKLRENNADIAKLFPGLFHEGVYISKKEGWRGAHSIELLRDPNYDEFSELNKASHNSIKVVNIAPEEPGALRFIERAVADGIKVSLGHACPNAAEVADAVKCGASLVTHFGNGSHPTIHRHDNPFWSFMAHDELSLGIIGDGFHLPPDIITTVFKVKGPQGIIMVSDCAGLSGAPAGVHRNGKITISPTGYLHLTGKEILAGSWHQIDRSVELLCSMGWTLADAWKQCSEIPAAFFNIAVDRIEVGAPANFVLSNYTAEKGLTLENIIHDGCEITPLPVNPILT